MARPIATRSGCWYVFMVDVTEPPPSKVYEMVFRCQGIRMDPIKPARHPTDPRGASFKIPRGPHFVVRDASHPVRAPIAAPTAA